MLLTPSVKATATVWSICNAFTLFIQKLNRLYNVSAGRPVPNVRASSATITLCVVLNVAKIFRNNVSVTVLKLSKVCIQLTTKRNVTGFIFS